MNDVIGFTHLLADPFLYYVHSYSAESSLFG
jgi:hypothetical protein